MRLNGPFLVHFEGILQTIARSLPFGSAARARALAQNKERRSRSRSHSKLRAPLALALSPSKSAALFALSIFFEENWTFLPKLPNGSFVANLGCLLSIGTPNIRPMLLFFEKKAGKGFVLQSKTLNR